MTPFTCDGRTRLNDSHEMPPKASGVMNSVARTSPNRSTTVSHTIEDRNQCFAARSVNGAGRTARSLNGGSDSTEVAPVRSDIGATLFAHAASFDRNDEIVISVSFAGHPR